MKAALDGLEAVKGDLSDGQKKYREALSKMTLKTPTGDVKLDANRQAIGTHLRHRGGEGRARATSTTRCCSKVDNVNQTLGMKTADFKIGSRDVPDCP